MIYLQNMCLCVFINHRRRESFFVLHICHIDVESRTCLFYFEKKIIVCLIHWLDEHVNYYTPIRHLSAKYVLLP
jgi:hypothetical protein